jgi:N-acetylneuraminic acid mutarotase
VLRRLSIRYVPIIGVLALIAALLFWSSSANAATAVRINAGGAAQTVDGNSWSGCTAVNACGGYVSGGFPWSENPSSISGAISPDSQTIEKSEWTGGSTNGVPWGGTAFTFNIPVSGSAQYTVNLHFTENNKTAVGQRVFDVKINNNIVLSNFDIFQQAGGEFKTIVRSFTAPAVNGQVSISFIRKTENAKVSAIEVLGSNSTTTSSTVAQSTTTTAAPTTTTAAPKSGTLSWNSIASVPTAGVEATGAAVGTKMYVFGGYYNNVWLPTNKAFVYDTAKNTWSTLPAVPKNLTHGATVVNGDNLIVAGGYSTNSSGGQTFALNNVWNFNTDTNTWSNLPNLPAARGSGGLAKMGNILHFFGGVDGNRVEQPTHWTLDLNNLGAGWQTSTPMPFLRTHFPAIPIGTSIYIIGGLTGIDANSTEYSTVYKYDTTTSTWSNLGNAPIAMSHTATSTVLYNGKIWSFGGEPHYGQMIATVYVYDPATNTWATNTQLPQARFAANAVNINGTFYFAMGSMSSTTAWKGTFN